MPINKILKNQFHKKKVEKKKSQLRLTQLTYDLVYKIEITLHENSETNHEI